MDPVPPTYILMVDLAQQAVVKVSVIDFSPFVVTAPASLLSGNNKRLKTSATSLLCDLGHTFKSFLQSEASLTPFHQTNRDNKSERKFSSHKIR